MASEANRPMATAISSATSMMSEMCSQASHIAASGSANAATVPAVVARMLIGWLTAWWFPSTICTVAVNQAGGDLPRPLLWPQSGFSKAIAGSKRIQTPGAMRLVVSMVRHSGTGKRCSRVLLLCSMSSRQYRPSNARETRSADAAVALSMLRWASTVVQMVAAPRHSMTIASKRMMS